MQKEVNISNVFAFTRGTARFERIDYNPHTHVQAWKRSYSAEPWRDRVEFFISDGMPFYPFDRIKKFVRANDAKFREKVDYYLQNGLESWFPGDEPKSIFSNEN